MDRVKCVECNKTLRNYKPGEKKIHRKCWINLRDKNERHFDFLFCKDKSKREMKKTTIIPTDDLQPTTLKPYDMLPPINENEVHVLDTKGNLISIPRHFIIEHNVLGVENCVDEEYKLIAQIMDIAGNIYELDPNLISSSPPPPQSPPSTDSPKEN